MTIPKNILREHVLKAIKEIDERGVEKGRESKTWILVYNGQEYPTKYVISLANKYANGEPLDSPLFTTQQARRYLKKLGFKVIKIAENKADNETIANDRELNRDTVERKINTNLYRADEVDKFLYKVFEKFASLLKRRFNLITKGGSYIKGLYQESEDSIRYLLFHTLTYTGKIDPIDIYLEYPHERVPNKKYAKLDTYVIPRDGRPALAFEIKFKTRRTNGRSPPKTQTAGKAFADILRLAIFKPNECIKRYFVYVVDDAMIIYYRNKNNNLIEFFDLELNRGFKLTREYLLSRSETFVKSIRSVMGEPDDWPEPIVICRYRDNLQLMGDINVAVRIYEIKIK